MAAVALIAVQRSFDVAVPPAQAWDRLAEVERWPEWAPHIKAVTLSPPSRLGPSSSGAFRIRHLGRNAFTMSAWDPPDRWEWTGGLPGVRVVYDHRFAPASGGGTVMTWVVALEGPLARIVSPIFAKVYGRNVDRAIPRLQDWIRS